MTLVPLLPCLHILGNVVAKSICMHGMEISQKYYRSSYFPGGSDGKESACNVGDLGSIPEMGRPPGGGHGKPLQYSSLENPHGKRSLAGYSPWGRKELDMTE